MKRRALISVTDKTGVVDFAAGLSKLGFEVLSTGGTARTLREAGLEVLDVSDVTQFPEMLEGRVKTLHPKVHGGLLGDVRNAEHRAQMAEAEIEAIEVLCVNLYAFEQTVTQPHTLAEAVESIDIGGPAMIRAGAKNSANVCVVVDPEDYEKVLAALVAGTESDLRTALMAKAFRHTAYYDSVIARYFSRAAGADELNELMTFGFRRALGMRYGENPHQQAGLYLDPLGSPGVANGEQLWGKELSYNNVLDSDAAWELVADLPPNSCAIIKHGNPCGAATAASLAEAYNQAREADPISAFGGIAAFNGEIDSPCAEAMTAKGNFLEVVIGTNFTPEAVEIFQNRSGWGQSVRLIRADLPGTESEWTLRTVRGGVLIQTTDEDPTGAWRIVSKRAPSESEWNAMRMLWTIVKHVKSNAIVVGTESRLLGVGAGQMNRVQSVRLALEQARDKSRGAALASDAFFPFPDSIETAAAAGISAIVQPGGSKKDDDVIAAADAHGLSLVFTGVRHFRH